MWVVEFLTQEYNIIESLLQENLLFWYHLAFQREDRLSSCIRMLNICNDAWELIATE
jgi:hypothetical protein